MSSLLITGGTGSLGRAVLRAALEDPAWARIVLLSRDDYKQHLLAERLGPDPRVRLFLGDVRDLARLVRAFHGIEAVLHAAALKWVADGVEHTDEIMATNFGGTVNVIGAAMAAGVRRVLVVTSDKACHPTTSYGASKLAAEYYAVGANSWAFPQGTAVACVRLGNLLWSRGSVLHRFRAQHTAGVPFRLTHERMTRFGMPLSEAARYVLACLAHLRGGEIFVPWLGAFRVRMLAEALDPRWPITVTGVRGGGEKLHETLVTEEESARAGAVRLGAMATYVIEPAAPTWTRRPWAKTPWVLGHSLRSDTAPLLLPAALAETLAEADAGLDGDGT